VNTTYAISVLSTPEAAAQLAVTSLPIPPRTAATLLVVVEAPGGGVYTLEGRAVFGDVQASDTATLIVIGEEQPPYQLIYLPVILR
jgi:hypothetical protein